MERLQKYMAHAGIDSRRKCEELIKSGKVKVNGIVINELGFKINPLKDKVEVNNKLIGNKEEKIYILLNKPTGYVTTLKDNRGRATVKDLVSEIKERIYPVGRLDYDTEGLLLMTNDGELSYRLTHPSYKVAKKYLALVKGITLEENLEKLRKGIMLEDGITQPAKVTIRKRYKNSTLVEIIIREGRNRQVRRMFQAINYPVLKLKRTSIGSLKLDNIPQGSYRVLTSNEINNLKKSIGLR